MPAPDLLVVLHRRPLLQTHHYPQQTQICPLELARISHINIKIVYRP